MTPNCSATSGRTSLTSRIYLVVSIAYSIFLALLPSAYFRDRENYETYASNALIILEGYDNLIIALFNEPLFLYLNSFLSIFLSSEAIPKVFVFFNSFTFSYLVLKKSRNVLCAFIALFCLFFIAQSFSLQLVVLRQGLATALFAWLVYFYWGQKRFYILLPLLALIHSSFFFITVMFYADRICKGFFGSALSLRIFTQIFLSIIFTFVGIQVAAALGVRQADSAHITEMGSVGGGNFLLWSLVFLGILSLSRQKLKEEPLYLVAILGLAVYLTMYFINPISGRLVATFLPFFIASITMSMKGRTLLLMAVVMLLNLAIFYETIKANSLTDYGIRALS